MKNIYDLNNVDDLPDFLKEDLKRDSKTERLFDIIKSAGRPVKSDEIMVAYFRKYGGIKSKEELHRLRSQLGQRSMKNRGVKQVRRAFYVYEDTAK